VDFVWVEDRLCFGQNSDNSECLNTFYYLHYSASSAKRASAVHQSSSWFSRPCLLTVCCL